MKQKEIPLFSPFEFKSLTDEDPTSQNERASYLTFFFDNESDKEQCFCAINKVHSGILVSAQEMDNGILKSILQRITYRVQGFRIIYDAKGSDEQKTKKIEFGQCYHSGSLSYKSVTPSLHDKRLSKIGLSIDVNFDNITEEPEAQQRLDEIYINDLSYIGLNVLPNTAISLILKLEHITQTQ